MKKIIKILMIGSLLILSSCTSVKPLDVTSNNGPTTKIGEATCKIYFGLVNLGECGYEMAKKNGGITQVHHADVYLKDYRLLFVSFYAIQRTQVYGN
jgi:hypothetical protein